MLTRALLVFGLLAPFAAGSETDGGHAPARRWTHPRGPASGNARSTARAPETFGGIRWTYKASKTIMAPPVTWDGIAFLVDGTSLIALRTETGAVAGRISLKKPGVPRPAADDGSVFLIEEGQRLVQYRHQGSKLTRRWSYDAGPGTSPARILQGEIYLATPSGLLRLRAGSRKPVWKVEGKFGGEPAVFQDHVYAVRRLDGKLMLARYLRLDGKLVDQCELGDDADPSKARVVVTDKMAAVRLPPINAKIWALIGIGKDGLELSRKSKLLTQPMGGTGMLLALDDKSRWSILRIGKRPVMPLTSKKQRPDLVAGAPSCVFLRNYICFGTWTSDVNANRILWHLSERRDTTAFRDGLRYGAVPAGHDLLLVVPRDGKSLRAIGPEEIE